jgi:hypothetical protein
MAFIGTAPLGSLVAGALAARFGAPVTIAVGGAAAIAAALYFRSGLPRLRTFVTPIYQRLGIVPEVARGIQAATHQISPRVPED